MEKIIQKIQHQITFLNSKDIRKPIIALLLKTGILQLILSTGNYDDMDIDEDADYLEQLISAEYCNLDRYEWLKVATKLSNITGLTEVQKKSLALIPSIYDYMHK